MKKLFLILAIIFAGINLFGQNTYKYPMYFNGGVRIGLNGPLVDSTKIVGDTIYSYVGTDIYKTPKNFPLGSSYTFQNGLTESGGVVKLGGVLSDVTTLFTGSNRWFRYTLTQDAGVDFECQVDFGGTVTYEDAANVVLGTTPWTISPSGSMIFTDSRATTVGIQYAADYSANWTDHSLVTKKWVVDNFSGGSMVYPGVGIALSTGSAWGTSIVDNSVGWNMAYLWGDHSTFGYAPLAAPTFTGTVTIPTPFTIGVVSMTATGTELNILDGATLSTTELNYVDGVTSAIQTQLDDTITGSDYYVQLTDTVPLVYFGSGVGLAGDTILIDASLNGYGYYYSTEDSTEFIQLITNIPSGDTVNYLLVYASALWNGSPTTIATIHAGAGETITTSFSPNTIPEDQYIWIEMDAVVATRKPVKFRVELLGYIKRD